jgi:peptidoglycan/LPS O-acetylase OafA/YrhL
MPKPDTLNSAATERNRSRYIPTLDGWRAVAILWVLESHGPQWNLFWVSNHWVKETGTRGVSLFFALSGFLICNRLLREEERFGTISLRSFYTRRFFRIQPAAFTYLLVVALLSVCGVIPLFWPGIAGAVLMIRNIWPIAVGPGHWYTSHFWSLAVEEHFYLLLPGFLVLIRHRRLAILASVALLLEIWRIAIVEHRLPMLAEHTTFKWQLMQRTDLLLDGILLGSLCSLALTHQRFWRFAVSWVRPWMALVYTAILFVAADRHHSLIVQDALLSTYPVLIVSTALHPNSVLGRFLELAPVRFLGRISYSLYLWQQLFIYIPDSSMAVGFHAHFVLCWCATFACAIASYYLIETPLIRRGHRLAKRFDLQEMDRHSHVDANVVVEA